MTIARQQSTDFLSCLTAGLPFAKAFTLGLIATWLVSIVLGTAPAHASDPAAARRAQTPSAFRSRVVMEAPL